MNVDEIRRNIYNAGWDIRMFIDGMDPHNKINEIKDALRKPYDEMRNPFVLSTVFGLGILGLCNMSRLLGESFTDPSAAETPASSDKNIDSSSEKINWQSVLMENGYFSDEAISEIDISTEPYHPNITSNQKQIVLAELSPYFNIPADFIYSWQGLLVVVRPGDRELPFEENEPGSWWIHTFTFPNDLTPQEREEFTIKFIQAYVYTAGRRKDCDNAACIEISVIEFPLEHRGVPSQPQGALLLRQIEF